MNFRLVFPQKICWVAIVGRNSQILQNPFKYRHYYYFSTT